MAPPKTVSKAIFKSYAFFPAIFTECFPFPNSPSPQKLKGTPTLFAFSTFPNKDPITPKVLGEGVLGAWGKGGGTLPPRQNYRSCAAIQLMASRRSSVPS